ncbi:MAG TPA: type IV pili twitching motility protein PilT, partial [Gammaproteobacteria bacterium]|nr:type IV pili twitching motility protein PilT [Gammaproteobacteria bacterium]
ETAEMLLKAANTGHLVLATMHTKSAPGAVSRLIDFFEPERQGAVCADLADAIGAVISQALIPSTDKTARVLAYEIMTTDGGVGPQIRKGKLEQIPNEMRQGASYGMTRMDDTLAKLVKEKRITIDEAVRHSASPEEFRRVLVA